MSRTAADRAADNSVVADMLREAAELLSAQQANPFRVAAYRKAAASIAALAISVRDIFLPSTPDFLSLPDAGSISRVGLGSPFLVRYVSGD